MLCQGHLAMKRVTLSNISPGAMSTVCPRRRKSETPCATASIQCPPESNSTRNGNSTWLVSRMVNACASIWWTGMKGFLDLSTSPKL